MNCQSSPLRDAYDHEGAAVAVALPHTGSLSLSLSLSCLCMCECVCNPERNGGERESRENAGRVPVKGLFLRLERGGRRGGERGREQRVREERRSTPTAHTDAHVCQ